MLRSAISGPASRNSHAYVVDELGKAIVSGELKVGALLPGDAELVERFSVSRTVLREAMKTLAAKGLVFARARVGTRVTERNTWNLFDADVLTWHLEHGLDRTFLTHLSEMRLAFEPFAARLAARNATADEIARMYGHADAMCTAGSSHAIALADLALHTAVLEASGNPFMYSVGTLIEAALVTSFQLSSAAGDLERQRAAATAHRAIVEAIEARDPDAAAEAMQGVIIEGLERVTKIMP